MINKYKNIDFDSPEASILARKLMQKKKCLKDIYVEMYNEMIYAQNKFLLPINIDSKILEIGSGGGFLQDELPCVITSDVKKMDGIDIVLDAQKMPFNNGYLDGIFSVFVLHHIPNVVVFFNEADRVLKKGGGIVCIETYYGPFARLLYKKVHPEPYDEKSKNWEIELNSGPMSTSNQALSYFILKRDREKFDRLFPQFEIVYQRKFGFLRYILTGGIWLKPMIPQFAFPLIKLFEKLLTPVMHLFAIHHIFVIKKKTNL